MIGMRIETLPRIPLANLPTPLEELPRLSQELGGPRLFIKRDDETGLGFGGNKTRKLEYLLADALRQRADTIITGAGFHSNWCTQTACAAKRLGLDVILVKQGPRDGYDPEEYDGNHLLHVLLGADIRVVTSPSQADAVIQELTDTVRARGRRPYLISFAGSTPLGVAGYVNAVLEILTQCRQRGIQIDYIVHATGSGGTQAGLILGAKAFNTGMKVLGVSVSPSEQRGEAIARLVADSAQLFDLRLSLGKDDVTVIDDYVGGGYGVLSKAVVEAIQRVAKAEGIFLDPVYSGKAMAGLIDLIRKNYFQKEDTVLFLHTGGTAALFPYKNPLKAFLKDRTPSWTTPPWAPR
jgi:L-cysteate sulfo-lyase